jgi:hypothetical protein
MRPAVFLRAERLAGAYLRQLNACATKRIPPQRGHAGRTEAVSSLILVELVDGHSLLRLFHLHDFVASAHLAFLQDAEGLITVADAYSIVGESLDCEVLAELSVDEVGPLH